MTHLMNFSNRRFILIFLGFYTTGCKDPKKLFDNEIVKMNFIPFNLPMSSVEVGAIVRGTPQKLSIAAPAQKCFPDYVNGLDCVISQGTKSYTYEIHNGKNRIGRIINTIIPKFVFLKIRFDFLLFIFYSLQFCHLTISPFSCILRKTSSNTSILKER